jgi:hypothetical protein
MLSNGRADLDFPKNPVISVDELHKAAAIRLDRHYVLPLFAWPPLCAFDRWATAASAA